MLEGEVKRIAGAAELRPEEFSLPTGKEPYRYTMRKKEGKCIFLNGIDCQIYPHRPLLCRFYPFWLEELDGDYEFKVSGECPGVGIGRMIKEKDFRGMLNKALELHAKSKINEVIRKV
jgi:Fe-S-cluster containining protein